MVTPDEMRALALSMPGAEEKGHFGQPDFRVKNKIFCGLSRDARTGTLKLSPDAQSMVVEAKPKVFYPASGAWGRSGWTHVVLADADMAELRVLIEEGWRMTAPKTLVASHRADAPVAKKPAAKKPAAKKPAAKKPAAKGTKKVERKKT